LGRRQRRHRHLFQLAHCGWIGLVQDILGRASQVFAPHRHNLFIVGLENGDDFDHRTRATLRKQIYLARFTATGDKYSAMFYNRVR